ncbi:MAG TPA: prepilin-type N-terminal cleavage/methylation domain-containing protein [Pirellulaceae bacterium]|nr:prepilin-type N-terminal cleavage/methylation domain-containing protein [Pirellulaceae bacterium]
MPFDPRDASTSIALDRSARRGLTLIELLLTIAVLGILAAALIPQLTSDLPERLDAAAQVVAADLDYTRALAVAHNSTYQVVFQPAQNRYFLRHSGANSLLNALPRSPFRQNSDAPDQQTTRLADLPLPEPGVRLVGAVVMQGGGQAAGNVEFTPLGGTTTKYETVVWLACGQGGSQRYISVHINPITGLSEIGPLQGALPPAVAAIQF